MECTCALLIQSGLTRFLWEEAMKHTIWLQNHTPAQALDGKTPYCQRTLCRCLLYTYILHFTLP